MIPEASMTLVHDVLFRVLPTRNRQPNCRFSE